MKAIKITITRFIDSHQPGVVECILKDAFGTKYVFHEKVPIVTEIELDENSVYPQLGVIGCKIISSYYSATGMHIFIADTSEPWDIESVDGCSRFEIFEEQVTEF